MYRRNADKMGIFSLALAISFIKKITDNSEIFGYKFNNEMIREMTRLSTIN